MHSCKTTREQMIERLLGGVETGPAEPIGCEECDAELVSLRETLRLTNKVIETTAPAKDHWQTYQVGLKRKLANAWSETNETGDSRERSSRWKQWLTASVRIPIPVGAAIVLLFGVSLVFALQRSRKTETIQTVSVVQVPVEVPVVEEKVVTRVVYRQSRKSRAQPLTRQPDNQAVAKSRATPVSLSEFKPLDEVKFTIIKGGTPDEK